MGRHEAWRPPGWRCSWHTAFLAASVLSSCFLLTRAQETTGISIRVVPEVLKEGDSVTLTPEGLDLKNIASCKWYRGAVEERNMIISFFRPPFSGETKGPAHTGRETVKPDFSLYITDLKPADSGIYSFKPEGPGVTITGATNITVSESTPPGSGLTPGQIVGIVIGCVLGVALIGGLGYFLFTKTALGRTEQHSSNGNIPSAPGRNQGVTDTKPTPGEEDIQYSTLAFKANHPPQPQPAATRPLESNIIYSEIKKK
uniref:Immunoglobulin domain-containing protein n=1 Tax=Podarcis muralis TaxID=64176 RepID=A0A670IVM5_PODMU